MVRVEALNALSQMDAAAALPILRRVLERREDCLVELRRRAIFMLARRADTEATSLLISAGEERSERRRARRGDLVSAAHARRRRTRLPSRTFFAPPTTSAFSAPRCAPSCPRRVPAARTSLRGLLERRDASETLRLQVLEAYQ